MLMPHQWVQWGVANPVPSKSNFYKTLFSELFFRMPHSDRRTIDIRIEVMQMNKLLRSFANRNIL
jgi:hypothetical protein